MNAFNVLVVEGAQTKIVCATGHVIIIDTEDAPTLSHFAWRASLFGKEYRPAVKMTCAETGKSKTTLLYRFLLNAPPTVQVDHINGDPMDNRKANLRFCTAAENSRNRKPHSRKRDGHLPKGVYLNGARYAATICKDYKRSHLGTFDTIREAEMAYDAASLALHGEFSRPNAGGVL
jgi:hypothetical protein